MLHRSISGVPVVDADGALVGIVTERDLLRRAEIGTERKRPRWLEFWLSAGTLADEYVRSHARRVEDVMSRNLVTIGPEMPAGEIVVRMERHGLKRLPVVQDGRLVGIVSRADLLRALSRQFGSVVPEPVADDIAIRRHILDEIERRDWASGITLSVGVRGGVVELRGSVIDDRVRDAVRVMAENAPGAKQVVDEISVVPPVPALV